MAYFGMNLQTGYGFAQEIERMNVLLAILEDEF